MLDDEQMQHGEDPSGTKVVQGDSLTQAGAVDLAEFQRFGSGDRKGPRLLTLISASLCLSILRLTSSVDRLLLACN